MPISDYYTEDMTDFEKYILYYFDELLNKESTITANPVEVTQGVTCVYNYENPFIVVYDPPNIYLSQYNVIQGSGFGSDVIAYLDPKIEAVIEREKKQLADSIDSAIAEWKNTSN